LCTNLYQSAQISTAGSVLSNIIPTIMDGSYIDMP